MSALSDSIKISGRQSEFQIACHAANSFCNQNECTVEEIYHVQNIMKNLNCGSGIDVGIYDFRPTC